jgi:L-ascorbate 6-phosphate lactonase
MAETLGIEWLGQSGYLFTFPTGITVCLDPYLSHAKRGGQTRERLTPIVLPASQLAADLVIITHDHIDHFDEITLRPIAERPATIFAGPSSCRAHWLAMGLPGERFVRLDQGESREIAGVRLTALYAEHASGDTRDAIGVTMEAGGFRIYQTGDSEYTERLEELALGLQPDLLTVPINGRGGNMTAAQAAQLTALVAPRVVIPMHYGMFRDNTADPQDFLDACQAQGVTARIVLLKAGRRFDLG